MERYLPRARGARLGDGNEPSSSALEKGSRGCCPGRVACRATTSVGRHLFCRTIGHAKCRTFAIARHAFCRRGFAIFTTCYHEIIYANSAKSRLRSEGSYPFAVAKPSHSEFAIAKRMPSGRNPQRLQSLRAIGARGFRHSSLRQSEPIRNAKLRFAIANTILAPKDSPQYYNHPAPNLHGLRTQRTCIAPPGSRRTGA
jgi:hypothetical protein